MTSAFADAETVLIRGCGDRSAAHLFGGHVSGRAPDPLRDLVTLAEICGLARQPKVDNPHPTVTAHDGVVWLRAHDKRLG